MLRYFYALLFAALISGGAVAKEPTKAAQKFVKQDLELKGVRLGDPLDKIKADFAASCSATSCSVYFIPGQSRPNPIPEDKRTFASRPVLDYTFKFEDGKLIEMAIKLDSDDFQLALLTLLEKFGEPQIKDKDVVQNAYGATFNNLKGTWKSKDGSTIYVERFFPDLKSSYIFLRDKNYLTRTSSSTKKPSSDI